MIRQKECCSCDRYDSVNHYGSDSCEWAGAYDTGCERWTPKHGEWIVSSLCRPEPGELVLIQIGKRAEYKAETDSINGMPMERVRCWLRIPGAE